MKIEEALAELRAAAERLAQEHPDLAADEIAWLDTIDGETSGIDLLEWLAERCLHLEAMEDTAIGRAKALHARARRFAADQERLRGMMLSLLEAANLTKLVRPGVTLSARTLVPKLVNTDPDATPADYTREVVTRVPDKDRIKEALQIGAVVDGWMLSNGGKSITIRTK